MEIPSEEFGKIPGLKYVQKCACSSALTWQVVIECEPTIRTIGVGYDYTEMYYRISLPYLVFIFNLRYCTPFPFRNLSHGCFLGAKKEKLTSPHDVLHNPLLPNVSDNLSICMNRLEASGTTFSEAAKNFITIFWGSNFNSSHDRDRHFTINSINYLTLGKWHQKTKQNPEFWKQWTFPSAYKLSNYFELRGEVLFDSF